MHHGAIYLFFAVGVVDFFFFHLSLLLLEPVNHLEFRGKWISDIERQNFAKICAGKVWAKNPRRFEGALSS